MDLIPSATDILLLPTILCSFAAFVYFASASKAYDRPLSKGTWVTLGILLGLAFLFGFRYTWLMINPTDGAFYRAGMLNVKSHIVGAHYAAPFFSIAALGAVFILERFRRRKFHAELD